MNELKLLQFHFLLQILTVLFEKSKTLNFISSTMENIVAPSALSRFPVKLICCIVFGSASTFYRLLKSIAINL